MDRYRPSDWYYFLYKMVEYSIDLADCIGGFSILNFVDFREFNLSIFILTLKT